MRLPNADQARVERAKAADYLLSTDHPHGRDKAAAFLRFGFSPERWEEFAEALRVHGAVHDIARAQESPYGKQYAVEGILTSPDGRDPLVRAIWEVRHGTDEPRLVSAYPIRRIRAQGA